MIFNSNFTEDYEIFTYETKPEISSFSIPYREFSIGLFKIDFNERVLYEFLINEDAVDCNIFTRYPDNEIIADIRKKLLTNYQKYCTLTGNMKEKVFIHSWYDVTRKGEQIKKHPHDIGTYSFLSANIYVRGYDPNSETRYHISSRDEYLNIIDNVGDLTIFPSWVTHDTNVYLGEQPKINIGIQIYPMRFYEYFRENNHNWIEHVYTS
jgi:hypothetical protein